MCSETTVLLSTQLAFTAKFPKNGRFRLPWSVIDLQCISATVAPRDVKLQFGRDQFLESLPLAVDFYYAMSRFFCKLHLDTNRVKSVMIHRCIDEGYGLIQIFTEKNTDSPHEITVGNNHASQ